MRTSRQAHEGTSLCLRAAHDLQRRLTERSNDDLYLLQTIATTTAFLAMQPNVLRENSRAAVGPKAMFGWTFAKNCLAAYAVLAEAIADDGSRSKAELCATSTATQANSLAEDVVL